MTRPILAGALCAAAINAPRIAAACGCFAAPSPAVPVVQAAERIVFAREDNRVVAHIEIQYEGAAEDFGWLIPLPTEPDFRLGAQELFDELENATAPTFLYAQNTQFCGDDGGGFLSCSDDDTAFGGIPAADQGDPNQPTRVLVKQFSAGPFESAALRADSKAEVLEWLEDNRYVVPDGGEDLLDPYIREGAFFLAIKLRSDADTGDLQPIVIEYEADNPMIPLILTQLGAVPDMGVLVWVLGDARAVPTNYRHVLINDEYIDWVNGAANYAQVIARAVDEAEDGHAFVTEYAGTSAPVVGVLDPQGRFGRRDEFESITDAIVYVTGLEQSGFDAEALRPIYEDFFPIAPRALEVGIDPDVYYQTMSDSLSAFDPNPEGFDPVAMTAAIWERIVEPTLAAGALLRRHGYLTRLYTAISPDEMTEDPTFAFNPDLPNVSNQRWATMIRLCDPDDDNRPWQMTLNDGRRYYVSDPSVWTQRVNGAGAPRAAVIEQMRLEGPPIVEVDNRATLIAMSGSDGGGGCRSTPRHRWSGLLNFALLFGSVIGLRHFLRRREARS